MNPGLAIRMLDFSQELHRLHWEQQKNKNKLYNRQIAMRLSKTPRNTHTPHVHAAEAPGSRTIRPVLIINSAALVKKRGDGTLTNRWLLLKTAP